MRAFWIVLDSVGIGHAPDADLFGDVGSNTLKRCFDTNQLNVPTMRQMGLFNIDGNEYGPKVDAPIANYARLCEASQGKDTTMGHWEMAGLISKVPFPTYPHGFPSDVIHAFEKATGRKVLCNQPYSGTQVIQDYGLEHMKTGDLIVYTSADSVFQIAAHEDIVPVDLLYDYCKKARKILVGNHAVARVIARPFVGTPGHFVRTNRRHDFSLEPGSDTILDVAKKAGKDVIGVGKIADIFAKRGLTESFPNDGNQKNMERTMTIAKQNFDGICYVNLVDFDMIYGHRRDISGYTQALNAFDTQLKDLISLLKNDDLLIITADHGCDPGYAGTDHTRECVPLLWYQKGNTLGLNLGTRSSFADIAASLANWMQLNWQGDGTSWIEV